MKTSKPYRPKLNRQAQRKAALAFLRCLTGAKTMNWTNAIDRADHQRKEDRERELLTGDAISASIKAGIDLERSMRDEQNWNDYGEYLDEEKAKLTHATAGIRSAWKTLSQVSDGLDEQGYAAMRELAETYLKITGEHIS